MRARALLALATALLAAGLVACAGDGGSGTAPGGGPKVVATTTQVGDLTREVGRGRAAVTQLLDPSSAPHEYEPKPSDARDVFDARLVVRSGGEVDAWLGDLLDNAGGDARTLTLIDAVRRRGRAGASDPHWWQDPRNAQVAVRRIAAALTAADPAGRAVYARNAARYERRLGRLDRAIAACMGHVPAARRKLVTDHDALGYYADRYGIEVVGTVIPALSTQAQASAGAIDDLVRTIRRENVTTIYPESAGNTRLQRAVAREASATVGPGLYADTLGAKGSAGATYVGSLRANTQALVRGFSAGRTRCALR